MSISFTKSTVDLEPPEPALDRAGWLAWRAAEDAKLNAIGTAVDSLVKSALSDLDVSATDVYATATIVSDATNVLNNDTVTIGTKVYTFKTTLSADPAVEGEVKIGADAATTLDYLREAINGTAAPTHHSCTAHTTVEATTNSDTEQIVQARTGGANGNAIAIAEASTHLSIKYGATTLHGGAAASVTKLIAAAGGAIMSGVSVQAVANGASATGLTATQNYRYLVVTYGTTYGSALTGVGEGTYLMALTASANLVVIFIPIC